MHWLDEIAADDYPLPDLDDPNVLNTVLDGIWGVVADDTHASESAFRRLGWGTDRELHLLMQVDRWLSRSIGPNPRRHRWPSRDLATAEASAHHATYLETPLVPAVRTLPPDTQWRIAARAVGATELATYLNQAGLIEDDKMAPLVMRWVSAVSADALTHV